MFSQFNVFASLQQKLLRSSLRNCGRNVTYQRHHALHQISCGLVLVEVVQDVREDLYSFAEQWQKMAALRRGCGAEGEGEGFGGGVC